ncbi:MAG: hypothetical protein IKM18_06360 [Clostridia bacterium]|nr:hypothetical protein [Clostridia bacterium]
MSSETMTKVFFFVARETLTIIAILEENALRYFRSSLILVDNQPTALNFVNCGAKRNDGVFDVLYEENTKIIIGFSVDLPDIRCALLLQICDFFFTKLL